MDAPEITETAAEEPTVPKGFMVDPKGNLIAEANVKPADRLMDQTVKKIAEFADTLSAEIARFKGHTYDDIESYLQILREEYGVTRSRSARGDITLTSFDGLTKVTVSTQDNLDFGPEIQIAKELIDELIDEWSEGATTELRTIVQSAFDTSKTGRLNRDAIFRLRRLEFEDDRWLTVQGLITDSVRSLGSKSYVRIHRRKAPDAQWEMIPLNISRA